MTDGIGVTDVPSEGVNVRWFRIVSWHIASGLVSRASHPKSLCGRWADGPESLVLHEDRPGNERTCESCLRIAGPR